MLWHLTSDSAKSTGSLPENNEDTLTSEKAILHIQDILETSLAYRSYDDSHSVLALALENFKNNFPLKNGKLAFNESRKRKFNLDELKEHVLKVIVPALENEKSSNHVLSNKSICLRLIFVVNKWPTQREFLKQKKQLNTTPEKEHFNKKEKKPFLPLHAANATLQVPFPDIIQTQANSKSTGELPNYQDDILVNDFKKLELNKRKT